MWSGYEPNLTARGSTFQPFPYRWVSKRMTSTARTEHVRFLMERLAAYESLNVVVIGYSGLDCEILCMLQLSENRIRSVLIVDANFEAALTVAQTNHGRR